jgi:flagellar biosynthesis protein FlhF
MELRRITGPDMRTALRMVREQLGPDAVILSNRRTAAGVEIVVGPEGLGDDARSTPPPARPAAPARAPLASGAGRHLEPAPAAGPPPAVAVDEEIRSLHCELQSLRELLEQRLGDMRIERMSWGPGIEGRAWRRLTRIGLPNALVHGLVSAMDPEAGWEEAWSALRVRWAGALSEAGDPAAQGGVLAVVGPTGAGKTTTLAKLAVRHVLAHGPDGLVIASLDAARIGGSDLLRALARLLEVPFVAAREGEDVAGLVARAGAARLLLIDTAGRSRRDADGGGPFAELGALAGRVCTLLVLPANAQHAWLASAVAAYREAAPAAAVITRLDETVSLGEVLGALQIEGLPLAYASDGQEIPDDLHLAHAPALIAQALALDPECEEPSATRVRRSAGAGNAARIA